MNILVVLLDHLLYEYNFLMLFHDFYQVILLVVLLLITMAA